MFWLIMGAIVAVVTVAGLGGSIGYQMGWADRGIENRNRRAQAQLAGQRHDRWETRLLKESRDDRDWEELLAQWAAEAGPRTWPAVDSTGPQGVIA